MKVGYFHSSSGFDSSQLVRLAVETEPVDIRGGWISSRVQLWLDELRERDDVGDPGDWQLDLLLGLLMPELDGYTLCHLPCSPTGGVAVPAPPSTSGRSPLRAFGAASATWLRRALGR